MGKYPEAEKLEIQVLDVTNRILGVKHPDTIRAMGNLASTYQSLEKYTEAEKLKIQVLNARNRILGKKHSDTIYSMGSLALTYRSLGKYTAAAKLETEFYEIMNRVPGAETPHTIPPSSMSKKPGGLKFLLQAAQPLVKKTWI